MDDLYREQILEHYKRPHNFGSLESADLEFEDNNPLCGDELRVQLVLDDERRRAYAADRSGDLHALPVPRTLGARLG